MNLNFPNDMRVSFRAIILLYSLAIISSDNCNVRVNDVLNALDKVLNYCNANSKQLNLDAAYGLILGKAHLSYLLNNSNISGDVMEKIRTLEGRLGSVVAKVIGGLEQTPKNILFSNTLLNPVSWHRNIHFNPGNVSNVSDSKLDQISTQEQLLKHLLVIDFDEYESDRCIMNVLKQQANCCHEHHCHVSSWCYRIMRLAEDQAVTPSYGVTHSLLYLQILQTQRCMLNEKEVNEKIQRFCSYIHSELDKNRQLGFLDDLDDLLLEQVILCGYEGFSEFFAHDIIDRIIQTQTASGCYGHDIQRRRKREANIMNDGCVDHTTGLAVSALSLTLRFLLQAFQDNNCA